MNPDRKALFLAALLLVGCSPSTIPSSSAEAAARLGISETELARIPVTEVVRLMGIAQGEIEVLPTATPEASLKSAWGRYLDQNGNVTGERVQILGTNGFNFVVSVAQGGRAEVPMEQLQIVEGYPWEEVVVDPRFGYRLDAAGFMDRIPLSGAGQVRIWGPFETVGVPNSDFERAVVSAEQLGIRPLVVLTPTELLADETIKEKIRRLLLAHPTVVIELFNEPDGPDRFWRGDMNSAAHFIKVAAEEARLVDPEVGIVIGAMWEVRNQPELLVALTREGFDLNSVIWGVHAYQSVESVRARILALGQYLAESGATSGIWVTELGVNHSGNAKRVLLDMVREAFSLGVVGVNVHELLDWEKFGVVKPDWSQVYPIFFEIAAAVRMGWRW